MDSSAGVPKPLQKTPSRLSRSSRSRAATVVAFKVLLMGAIKVQVVELPSARSTV